VTLLLLSTADTDLLAARSVPEPALPLRLGNPSRTEAVDLDGVALVLVRLLGGRRAWDGFDALLADCAERGIPVVAVGGEGAVDAELTAASTVPQASSPTPRPTCARGVRATCASWWRSCPTRCS
jgi:cobaltochelatase CobN